MNSTTPEIVDGIDISEHSTISNFGALPGVVILRASKNLKGGNVIDAKFNEYADKTLQAGKRVGFYHFLYCQPEIAKIENAADYFAGVIANKTRHIAPIADFEAESINGYDFNTVRSNCVAFMNRLKTHFPNEQLVIYTGPAFAEAYLNDPFFKQFKLWTAHYGVSSPRQTPPWDTWDAWQYSESGTVAGVSGGCDVNKISSSFFLPAEIHMPAPAPVSAPAPAPSEWTKDVYPVPSLPCDWNAIARTNFDVLNADGSECPVHHEVSNGDQFIIRSVDFDRQLAEILYPVVSKGCWVHGFIHNLQNLISDRWHFKWQNGSTSEIVYGSPTGGDRIGSIDPRESATPLYRVGGRIALLYNTAKGDETKFGFVDYNGGFTGF